MNKRLFSDSFAFDSDTAGFSWTNAYGCAMAANLAYEKKAVIGQQIEGQWGRKKKEWCFIDNKTTGTQAFAMTTDEIILIAFRGTEAVKDFITDANVDLIAGPLGGEVHEGFSEALTSVWSTIKEAIGNFRGNGGKSLWFTGHSLGAGLATLAVARLLDKGDPVDGLYTFGQPRTGDKRFARNFNLEFKPEAFRFVNNNDVVTRVPPRVLGYRHIGTFRYFDADGKFHTNMSKWNRFLDRMNGRFDDILKWGADGIKDHSMSGYLKLVRKKYEAEKE